MSVNGTSPFSTIVGVLGQKGMEASGSAHVTKGKRSNCSSGRLVLTCPGCIRNPSWPWWRQALPWWTLFFLVPIYVTCSSLSNLQYWRSAQLPVMVIMASCSYAANRGFSVIAPGRTDIVSAAGAFVIGVLGNIYSRGVRGTAFTTMVTGVLFLVPVSTSSRVVLPIEKRDLRSKSPNIVWHRPRRRRHANISQFGGAIFKWVLARFADDHGCSRSHDWAFREPILWYVTF